MGIIAGVAFGIAFSQVTYVIVHSDQFPLSSAFLSLPSLQTPCLPPCTLGKLIDGVRNPCSLVLRSSVYWFSFFNLNEVFPSKEYRLQFD